jgi:hypothetical protein
LRGRTLSLSSGASPVRVAVFSGPGLDFPPSATELEALARTQADVFVVLGGLGRNALATGALQGFASLQRLVVLVRGGVDGFAFDTNGQELPSQIVDASGIRMITLGNDTLIPWAGAESGRYALDDAGCGFSERDVEEAVRELGPGSPGERRWLLSWQLPSTGKSLRKLNEGVRARGRISAWPALAADASAESWDSVTGAGLLVPRAWGPRLERADGTVRAHGSLVLRFEADGPHLTR